MQKYNKNERKKPSNNVNMIIYGWLFAEIYKFYKCEFYIMFLPNAIHELIYSALFYWFEYRKYT